MTHAPAARIGSIALLAFSSGLILGSACEGVSPNTESGNGACP
jgi:hypothetical protein